jgi:hypothetical protein
VCAFGVWCGVFVCACVRACLCIWCVCACMCVCVFGVCSVLWCLCVRAQVSVCVCGVWCFLVCLCVHACVRCVVWCSVCHFEDEHLAGKRHTDDDLQHAVVDWLNRLAADWCDVGISKLVSRYNKCLNVESDYVEMLVNVRATT